MPKSVAIVTGAAGDIGRAIAARLGDGHDTVLVADINTEAAERTARELGGTERFLAVPCDVTDVASVAAMAQAAASVGTVRTLVNNAGAARAVSLHDTTQDIWRMDNALNLEAAFLCFRAVEEMLKESRGSVVNIASVNGMNVFGHPAYSAAKAGLLHLTRLIAVEYGKFGIRANAVAPATVRTQPGRHAQPPIRRSSRRRSAGIPCSVSSTRRTSPKRCISLPAPPPEPSPASACRSTAG